MSASSRNAVGLLRDLVRARYIIPEHLPPVLWDRLYTALEARRPTDTRCQWRKLFEPCPRGCNEGECLYPKRSTETERVMPDDPAHTSNPTYEARRPTETPRPHSVNDGNNWLTGEPRRPTESPRSES